MWIFIHKALHGLCKDDFITWDNFEELLILATVETKEGTICRMLSFF